MSLMSSQTNMTKERIVVCSKEPPLHLFDLLSSDEDDEDETCSNRHDKQVSVVSLSSSQANIAEEIIAVYSKEPPLHLFDWLSSDEVDEDETCSNRHDKQAFVVSRCSSKTNIKAEQIAGCSSKEPPLHLCDQLSSDEDDEMCSNRHNKPCTCELPLDLFCQMSLDGDDNDTRTTATTTATITATRIDGDVTSEARSPEQVNADERCLPVPNLDALSPGDAHNDSLDNDISTNVSHTPSRTNDIGNSSVVSSSSSSASSLASESSSPLVSTGKGHFRHPGRVSKLREFSVRKRGPQKKKIVGKDVKIFTCDECDKKFKTKANLKQHMVVHTNERRYVCNEVDCGKKFKQLSHLKQHERQHLSVKDLKCPYKGCAKLFREPATLAHHIRSRKHKNIRNFICRICKTERFSQQSNWKLHEDKCEQINSTATPETPHSTRTSISLPVNVVVQSSRDNEGMTTIAKRRKKIPHDNNNSKIVKRDDRDAKKNGNSTLRYNLRSRPAINI